MKLEIEFRKAKPEDLKQDQQNLKIGQTYAILIDGSKNVEGIFSLTGNEDPYILKYYLENGWILIPQNAPDFSEWIKEQESISGT